MLIRILITGGTFDKEYDLINGQLYFDDTHVSDVLERGRSTVPTALRTLMMIDSLDMTAMDRKIICEQCKDLDSYNSALADFPPSR